MVTHLPWLAPPVTSGTQRGDREVSVQAVEGAGAPEAECAPDVGYRSFSAIEQTEGAPSARQAIAAVWAPSPETSSPSISTVGEP